MTSSARRPSSSRRAAWLGAVVAILAVVPVVATRPTSAATPSSAPPAQHPVGRPYTVTADPTVNVDDGQLVTVTVKADPSWTIDDIQIQLCRPGIVYQSSAREDPAGDFGRGRANCPRVPISSNGSGIVDDSREGAKNAITPGGETLSFYVGSGTGTWTEPDGTPPPAHTLTCDVAHPCSLVVEVLAGPAITGATGWDPWVFDVKYQNADVLQTCGGLATGGLDTAGSERLTDAYINWTSQQCHTGSQVGAAGQFSATGEGDAMQLFDSGQMDAAYSSLGFDAAAKLGVDPADPHKAHRKAVAIPLALNATVMAVGNGEYVRGHKRPYDSMKLTTDEAAHLVAQGGFGLDQQAIVVRNPPMTGLFANLFGGMVVTSAKAESTSYLAARYFQQLSPGQWIAPNTSDFRDVAGQARPVEASFATAQPTFANVLATQTSFRSSVRKAQVTSPEADTGGMWLLTDRATAEALALTTVQITNSQGIYVTPTKASMTAAVPSMTPDEQGVLLPDPNTRGAVAGAAGVTDSQPYPLTFVEYVYAPAEALVDDACAPRTASQELLKNWLTYLIGPGQQKLPPGLEALPPSLIAQATDALAKVGASPSTKVCPPTPTTAPTTTVDPGATDDGRSVLPGFGDAGSSDLSTSGAGAPVGGDGSGGASSGATSGGDGSSAGGGTGSANVATSDVASAGTSPPGSAPPEQVVTENAAAGLPAFGGSRSASGVATIVAFLGIMLLVSAAAFMSSGRRRGTGSGEPPAGPSGRTSA